MEKADRLEEKYEQGLTSLEEERALSRKKSSSEGDGNIWFEYIELKRSSVPADIEEHTWEKVEVLQQKQRRLTASIITAAASVLVIAVLLTASLLGSDEKIRNREVVAALEKAKSMIPDNPTLATTTAIIYEDESIIIYIEE